MNIVVLLRFFHKYLQPSHRVTDSVPNTASTVDDVVIPESPITSGLQTISKMLLNHFTQEAKQAISEHDVVGGSDKSIEGILCASAGCEEGR